jgi:hypothetical protein
MITGMTNHLIFHILRIHIDIYTGAAEKRAIIKTTIDLNTVFTKL